MVQRNWVPRTGTLRICWRWIGWRKLRWRFRFGGSWRHRRTLADVALDKNVVSGLRKVPSGALTIEELEIGIRLASRRDPAQRGMPRSWRSGHVLGQTLDAYAGRRAGEPISNSFPILHRERGTRRSPRGQGPERPRRTNLESGSPRLHSAEGAGDRG